MNQVSQLIDELHSLKKVRKDKIIKILDALYENLEFEEGVDFVGMNPNSTGSLRHQEEKGIRVGNLYFSNGGNCYHSTIGIFDNEKNEYGVYHSTKLFFNNNEGEWKSYDNTKIPWNELYREINALPENLKDMIKKIQGTTPTI